MHAIDFCRFFHLRGKQSIPNFFVGIPHLICWIRKMSADLGFARVRLSTICVYCLVTQVWAVCRKKYYRQVPNPNLAPLRIVYIEREIAKCIVKGKVELNSDIKHTRHFIFLKTLSLCPCVCLPCVSAKGLPQPTIFTLPALSYSSFLLHSWREYASLLWYKT